MEKNGMPTAKKHAVLEQLARELRGARTQETFEVYGRKYTLQCLDPGQESWADGFVTGQSLYQTGRNRRAPYVAAALLAVEGTPIKELFQLPPDTEQAMREMLQQADGVLEGEWRRQQVLKWLVTDLSPPVLDALWDNYLTLVEKQKEALDALHPSLRTATGAPSATSSQEKAS